LEPLGHAGEIAEIVRVEKQLRRKRAECWNYGVWEC
jgi:hypothetical protein